MDHLECPQPTEWEERRSWFEQQLDSHHPLASFMLSEQASALLAEVQSTYCAGAWVATLVLAVSVIEAQLREFEAPDTDGGMAALINAAGLDERFHQLRRRRNSLVHLDPDTLALSVDQQWSDRDDLKRAADEAVTLMVRALYLSPGL